MTWFKNLKTMTKLMVSFGFLALLLVIVGYEGVSGMGEINGMLGTLYQRDMTGLSAIKNVATQVAMVGRQTRGALIYTDQAAIEKERDKVQTYFGQVDDEMKTVEGTYVTDKGKELVAELKQQLPAYRAICTEVIRLSLNKDRQSAMTELQKAIPVGDRINALVKDATVMKETFAQQAFETSARSYQSARTLMTAIMIGAFLMSIVLGYVVAKLIANPLYKTVDVLQGVASGDLTRSLDVSTADEVGMMAKALNTAVGGMRDALREVRGSADSLATASQQLAASSEELSSGSQEQASSLEETSASLEEITQSVKQNADSAKQANQLATAARDTAEKGGQVVSSAVTAMGEINTSTKKIADIITTIDEIAFQTNLLALNAAVEAARAGEQGRGFAVVAAEVRSLAQRSATAAKEIKALIQDSVRKVEAGSDMVNQSGNVLLEIVSSVKRVTDIVGEIAAASREQSSGVEQVAKAVSQMDQVTQQNASQTEELSATAQSLSAGADQLQGLVARFQLENGRQVRHTAAAPAPGVQKAAVKSRTFSKGLNSLSKRVLPGAGQSPAPVEADSMFATKDSGGFGDF